jgi:hypothetical protein
MKTLSEYLNDNFTMVNRHELLTVLKTCQLSPVVDNFILFLKNNPNQLADVCIISSALIININTNIKALETERRGKAELLLADLIFIIAVDFLKTKPLARDLILRKLKKQCLITCDLMGYDFHVFKKLIDMSALNAVDNNNMHRNGVVIEPVEISRCKLVWTKKGRLEELVYQLSERKLIKNKRALFDLFLNAQTKHPLVKWDFERKGHLAHLLFQLYKKNLINITSNRGYFSCAEKHFIGFDGTTLKTNSLKKLSSAIHSQPSNYPQVVGDVTEIIEKVTAIH